MNIDKWKKKPTKKELYDLIDCYHKEIERLNNIIKEVRELINYYGITPEQNDDTICRSILKQFLGILDKVDKEK